MRLSEEFLHDLRTRFAGDVRLDAGSRALYASDASIYQIEPMGVAIPKTQDDLQAAVELASNYAIPILPRGAGTSLGGQAIGEALILDCSRWLDKILEIDSDYKTATVEPGVVLMNLNRAAAIHGLMFGPDPASAERATMGGVIGNNATGAHSIVYGMTADHLLSADVILADGSLETWEENGISRLSTAGEVIRERYADAIKKKFPKSWRNSAGYRLNYLLPWSPSRPPEWKNGDSGRSISIYDQSSAINLASLLAGSEGTLAVMQRAKVRLVEKPKHTVLGVLAYRSIVDACDDVPRLMTFGPSAVELIPQMLIRLARNVPAYARQMGWVLGDPAALLVVEFSGDQPHVLKEAVRGIGNLLTLAESAEDQARVWNVRKVGLGILDSLRRSSRPVAFIEDCAIPTENLGEFVREVERILEAHRTSAGIYAHASGGCLHIRPILDLHLVEGRRVMRSIAEQILALVLKLGGSMSSEHGDGIVRGEWLRQTYGDEVLDAMRMLKRTADPHNLLNPNKLFEAPPMDSHLRYGRAHPAQPWQPALHFDHEGGLAGAIEQCNGQGSCRKNAGVMCPSFQATREEALSTRGRANLLRSLLAAPIPKGRGRQSTGEVLSSAAYNALDLCLACKGCSSECPSGVDMPKLKYEFMNAYFKRHRRPLRDYLFGYFHVVSKWLVAIGPLANFLLRSDWSRKFIASLLRISDQRAFPTYADRRAQVHAPHVIENQKAVIFLSDAFTRYLEPEVEQAAFDILHSAGFSVRVLSSIGAGASLLSKGFINAARKHAEAVLAEIEALDGGAGLSVVGCEPPELACLKHDYVALLPGSREKIESLSKRVWSLDEFLLRSGALNELRVVTLSNQITRKQANRNLLFQPHCHQRAEPPSEDGSPTGTSATVEMLEAIGYHVHVVDAGCCGMAGTFGFDAEHYDLSMQIGELGVLTAARGAEEVVSTGSACRMQIRHGTGREVAHPLLLLRQYLAMDED